MTDRLPTGWAVLDSDAAARVKKIALDALRTAPLKKYYDVASGYAGATFASITPNDPYDITGADLHALSMLSVQVDQAATRRVLDAGEHRNRLLDALRAVDPGIRLATASPPDLTAAWDLVETIRSALADPTTSTRSDPWVTTAKLAARKRPRLLPVRDTKVRRLLGLERQRDGHLEVQAMRSLVTDPEVMAELERAVEDARERGRAEGRTCVFDDEPLRLLDAALWMYAVRADPDVTSGS